MELGMNPDELFEQLLDQLESAADEYGLDLQLLLGDLYEVFYGVEDDD